MKTEMKLTFYQCKVIFGIYYMIKIIKNSMSEVDANLHQFYTTRVSDCFSAEACRTKQFSDLFYLRAILSLFRLTFQNIFFLILS